MKKTIDSSRTVWHKNEMIVFYVEIDYDDDGVDLNNYEVDSIEVRIDEDIYSTYENGVVFTHDMTKEIYEVIESHMHEYDFIEDVLMYEADNREPNIHFPDPYDQ